MAYRETGAQDAPVALFLHGNPTSSHIWRNILPLVAPVAHCIAPDLIGFGRSGKPAIAYRFFDHVRYLDALIEQLGITSAYLVAQDWGTALAFHLAARRPASGRSSEDVSSWVRGGRGRLFFDGVRGRVCRKRDSVARRKARADRPAAHGIAFCRGAVKSARSREL